MRNRGKREVEEYYYNNNNNNNNNNGDGIEGYVEFPCKKHPSSSTTSRGGICAFCLTDRLYQLVCPQCGEQRLSSSCSCSTTNADLLFSSNNPNSASSADVGNVGRISFLLENDTDVMSVKPKIETRLSSSHLDDFSNTLRRSNSTCVGIDRKESKDNKFWKIGRLFRKKKEKNYNNNNYEENINNINNNNNNYNNYECNNNNNNNGVSRSRSVSSFRGFYDNNEENGNYNNFPVSTSSAARASSVSTGNFYGDSAKMSCFSESEARFSNFDYIDINGLNKNNNYNNYNNNNNNNNSNNIYSVKESEFNSSDDPAYIDLKLDGMTSSSSDQHHSKRVPDLATMRRSRLGMSTKEFGYRGAGNQEQDMFIRSGSCRRSSVTERELRNCRKSSKVWKWFFKHQSSSSSSANHHDPQHEFDNSFDPS